MTAATPTKTAVLPRSARMRACAALLSALVLTLCAFSANALADDFEWPGKRADGQADGQADGRATTPAPLRHLLVKAMGNGHTPREAEDNALKAARALAVERLKPLGGERALFPGEEGQRVVSLHHFPQLGFSPARVVLLLELRLRGQAEPLPTGLPLLSLSAGMANGRLELNAAAQAEAVVAVDPGPGAEVELLPGGVQTLRLAPGKPQTLKLPGAAKSLHVLACTGGLSVPENPATVTEALTKSRTGRPHPSIVQGVVSDCVELRLGQALGGMRSLRQKGSETPVNMTGAAGRDMGLTVPAKDAP